MSTIANEIVTIVNTSNNPADKITSGLCKLGNGKMHIGLKKVATYYENEGYVRGTENGITMGEKTGMIKGASVATATSLVVGSIIYIFTTAKHKRTIKRLQETTEYQGVEIKNAFTCSVNPDSNKDVTNTSTDTDSQESEKGGEIE